MKQNTLYPYRNIARITIEADNPIAIGTGEIYIETDAPIAKDINGLPFIPATSIAGVLRHAVGNNADNFFGFQKEDTGEGSKIVFTDAIMIGIDGKPLEGIQTIDWSNDFYKNFKNLPIRQHVKINEKGTASDGGKFDNEIVYKGARFTFEMEMVANENVQKQFYDLISELHDNTFRIGSGTRKGYGKIKIVDCITVSLDLRISEDLQSYISKSSDLSKKWDRFCSTSFNEIQNEDWEKYTLKLNSNDFFFFGSGIGDKEADDIPITEKTILWADNKPRFSNNRILIPASSVKGAISHRTAYHYNKLKKNFIGNKNARIGDDNEAVATIFGVSGNGKFSNHIKRGNIIMSDVIGDDLTKGKQKIFFHIKSDYFTGGTINGTLFQEKSVYGEDNEYKIEILVKKNAIIDKDIREAFEKSLNDICDGLLPLGGIVNRGNGIFTGKLLKN